MSTTRTRRLRSLWIYPFVLSPIGLAQTPSPAPGPWPDDIESLLFDYLSELPGVTFPALDVRCGQHHCLATYVHAGGQPERTPGHEELSPLIWKGWHVISVGTGGSFDPATGETKGWIHFSNDGRAPPHLPHHLPPLRLVPLGASAMQAIEGLTQ
jgi:hypothetical protein